LNSIEVVNLTKKFGDFISVNNISFSVKEGEIFGFLGANGAGKTTTIKMMNGILVPTSGDAIVAGYSVMKDPNKVKLNIGYMSQRFSLYNDLSVAENIEFFGGVYGMDGKLFEDRKKWVLKISNLEQQEKLLTKSLPGGIKQRLALGTAVIHKPKIVFLDEPTSGVDPISRRSFWDLINDLSNEGITVLVTTHYLEEAEYCNNIILMDAGNIIAEGSSTELKKNYIKRKIFEIESSQTIKLFEFLKKLDFVANISIFGNNLHVSFFDENANSQSISKLLENSTLSINNVTEIIPTLEDVFIHLLEKKNDK